MSVILFTGGGGLCQGEPPGQRPSQTDPLDRDPPGQRLPRQRPPGQRPLDRDPLGQRLPPDSDPPGQRPPPRVTSGRYASYWNAFLFITVVTFGVSDEKRYPVTVGLHYNCTDSQTMKFKKFWSENCLF